MNGYTLGDHASSGTPVSLSEEERRRHLYLLGRTGTGKSSLLHNLMLHDLHYGRGFALIDPHGDLSLSIADSVPIARYNDVFYFNPLDAQPISFNPLTHAKSPNLQATIASDIVASFKHVWADSWGPRLEYILKNSLRLLLDKRGSTLLDLPRLLVDDPFRNRLIERCKDRYVVQFWTDEYGQWDKKYRREAISPVQNKVGQFTTDPILRAVIGKKSTINLRRIMDRKQVLLCNFSKAMGEEPSHLLGAFLTTALFQSATSRADTPEGNRVDFTLYVDEFQNFATDTFSTILSEARKFRLNLVLANQFLGQVPDLLRRSVIANVGTFTVFRIGAEDAPLLARELGTDPTALLDVPTFHAFVKRSDATLIRTRRPPLPRGSLGAVQARSNRNFVVTEGKGAYCFDSKTGGDAIWMVAHIKRCTMREAAQMLDTAFPATTETHETPEADPLQRVQDRLIFEHPDVQALGLDPQTAKRLGIGYAGNKGLMRGRVVLPLYINSKLAGFVGYNSDDEPQFKFPTNLLTSH